MEDMLDEIIRFTKEVGFPIAVTAYLMWERHSTLKELRDAILKVADAFDRMIIPISVRAP